MRSLVFLCCITLSWYAAHAQDSLPTFMPPSAWEYSQPLIEPVVRTPELTSYSQKDPSVVHVDGRWHVFMTVKLPGRTAIEYCAFEDWEHANSAPRHLLDLTDSDYFGAPQVFYFRPHRLWYLVYQVGIPGQKKMWVAYSTTDSIADPTSWTKARPMLDGGDNDPREVGGLDYWIICDDQRAHLFYTSLDGRMWRLWTTLDEFPSGLRDFQLALQGPFFEASHTYKLDGMDLYLTIVEENGQRYYKAYVAERLDGPWRPLADSADRPFAGWKNIRPAAGVTPWTDNVSHGELVRNGYDETMRVDPHRLRFVFQGVLERQKKGLPYGRIPWRIGILTPIETAGQ
ncbi:MAG: glycoside hydrolase family 62 [Planctomycetota bacterium]|nr:MAG: glycoside hydrolase family 62 [Planctomycetota bacterium]